MNAQTTFPWMAILVVGVAVTLAMALHGCGGAPHTWDMVEGVIIDHVSDPNQDRICGPESRGCWRYRNGVHHLYYRKGDDVARLHEEAHLLEGDWHTPWVRVEREGYCTTDRRTLTQVCTGQRVTYGVVAQVPPMVSEVERETAPWKPKGPQLVLQNNRIFWHWPLDETAGLP